MGESPKVGFVALAAIKRFCWVFYPIYFDILCFSSFFIVLHCISTIVVFIVRLFFFLLWFYIFFQLLSAFHGFSSWFMLNYPTVIILSVNLRLIWFSSLTCSQYESVIFPVDLLYGGTDMFICTILAPNKSKAVLPEQPRNQTHWYLCGPLVIQLNSQQS